MESIPKPEVLDAGRVLRDDREDMSASEHRDQAQVLDAALHQSCDYATQLWETLDSVRGYLYHNLPPVQSAAAGDEAGPDWPEGEQDWIEVSAAVTSVLCGPHGDSGFGRERAVQEAQRRRSPAPPQSQTVSPPPGPTSSEVSHAGSHDPQPSPTPLRDGRAGQTARRLAAVVLIALAARGMRPRRPASGGGHTAI